jgi:hypothetical protein
MHGAVGVRRSTTQPETSPADMKARHGQGTHTTSPWAGPAGADWPLFLGGLGWVLHITLAGVLLWPPKSVLLPETAATILVTRPDPTLT